MRPLAPPPAQYTLPGHWPGMVAAGNLDLNARPLVHNPDGSVSTVRSMSFGIGGHEVLLPTVLFARGAYRVVSPQQALQNYLRTRQSLGVFENASAANRYALALHLQQAGR